MDEGTEKTPITPATINRIIAHLNLPVEPREKPGAKPDVLIESTPAKISTGEEKKTSEEETK
jgi:hypothetical protein